MMSNDLIRRSDALKILNIDNSVFEWWGYSKLKELPAVDAVEVVHCRDCRHLKNGCRCYCPLGSGFDGGNEYMLVDEDDFCSYGERRSE